MRYRITHSTVYDYSQAVGLCQNEARLQPRNFARQQCQSNRFEINPAPADFVERVDYFGNRVVYFAVQQVHTQLTVTSISEVQVFPGAPLNSQASLPWETVRQQLQNPPTSNVTTFQSQQQQQQQSQFSGNEETASDLQQFRLDSPMVTTNDALTLYAQPSFQPNRPILAVVADLMARIFHDFTYDPSFTTIATPLSEVLHHRRGVCQDFAHLAIACLRAYGMAARYVSGYIETLTTPGMQRLVGADASHAWFSVYVPTLGWVDFDPTNNTLPNEQHITLAWGRDYSDVTPLKGIAFGGGQHSLSVSVDVLRLPFETERRAQTR
jgi:transglutaminase-like putative cysteine protease